MLGKGETRDEADSAQGAHQSQRLFNLGLLLMALGLFGVVLVRTAWLCDDAYISLRVIDNFLNGHGLRWNIGERVQVYTHPLWLLLGCGVHAVTREFYFTPLMLSLVVSLAAVSVKICCVDRSRLASLFGVGVLCLSRAFVDFSTSGLENPLIHLLTALFATIYLGVPPSYRRLLWLSVVTGLAATSRMDTVLLFAPALAAAMAERKSLRGIGVVALGCVPFAAWEVFSLVYYGFPFPNTAYAKLGTGIARIALVRQGMWYLIESLKNDPITLTTCVAALVAAPLTRDRRKMLPLALGMLLYLAYVVNVGGDFMSGRFLTPAFFLACLTLGRIIPARPRLVWLPALAAAAILGFVAPYPTLLSGRDCGKDFSLQEQWHFIKSERHLYYQHTGLLSVLRQTPPIPDDPLAKKGRAMKEKEAPSVQPVVAAGMTPFFAGPSIHFVDLVALTDPLMARLPTRDKEQWVIGHFFRDLPQGYLETLASGENQIADQDLAAYYDDISAVTRGPLFTWKRLGLILRMNLGLEKCPVPL